MGLFSDPEELERKEKLKVLEDKRLAFAQRLDREGFKPERMLFAQMSNGGFSAIAKFNGKQWLIVSPGLGEDADFRLEVSERFPVRTEEVLVKSEGMGGMLGFGKKGEHGTEYVVTLSDGSEVRVPFVYGRSAWAEFQLKKNPLLDVRRRRKDANIVWEFRPIDNAELRRILDIANGYFS